MIEVHLRKRCRLNDDSPARSSEPRLSEIVLQRYYRREDRRNNVQCVFERLYTAWKELGDDRELRVDSSLIQGTDHVDVRIISSLARLVEVAVEGDVSSVPAYRCPGLCPIGLVRAAAMMRQAHAVAQSVPDDDFPGIESPPRHICRIVVAPIG